MIKLTGNGTKMLNKNIGIGELKNESKVNSDKTGKLTNDSMFR